MRTGPSFFYRPSVAILLGVLLVVLTVIGLASWRYHTHIQVLEKESVLLQRLASQRAGQHDAHLTALAAVVQTTADQRGHELFQDVAHSILNFYPSIDAIELVTQPDAAELPTGVGAVDPEIQAWTQEQAWTGNEHMKLLVHPTHPGHYLLIKRNPNLDALGYALMLDIDAARLLGNGEALWSKPDVMLRLSLPDGTPFLGAATDAPTTLHFSKALSSTTQPLLLETGLQLKWDDLLPLWPTLGMALLVGVAYTGVCLAWRQRRRVNAAVEQARISGLESRLAHASRVNALGEMASGLTHELTQPLTAILAQSQAGRRLLSKGDTERLAKSLDETVIQAQRASAILEHFRHWSRPQRLPTTSFDLRDALHNVQSLLRQEAQNQQVHIILNVPATPLLVKADAIEMEQVLFNLLRNAMDALQQITGDRLITITASEQGNQVRVDVADNGPGVPAQLRGELFTPFVTGKEGGTGLGLALSQRLVERVGGELLLQETAGKGAVFSILLASQPATSEPSE